MDKISMYFNCQDDRNYWQMRWCLDQEKAGMNCDYKVSENNRIMFLPGSEMGIHWPRG